MEIWGGSNRVQQEVSTPGLDAWVYSQPYAAATRGGDVHYVSLCGGGEITRMIVADVSGHGETVAELSNALRTLMRRNINRKSQTRLVRALNKQFTELAQTSRFATAVVATYLASRDRLWICNAGHPRPLWFRAAANDWVALAPETVGVAPEAANLPLGLDADSPYDQFSVALDRGDLVVFYTDALTESRDPEGRLLAEGGLLEIARKVDVTDPREAGARLLAEIVRYRGGAEADDDVTLLALHHNAGPRKRLSVREKLDVYAKVFGLKDY
jgi:serine phosphatase RsbU (regulator of sigma subunit)